jgi:DmsE family decaheme c-type cytochrome
MGNGVLKPLKEGMMSRRVGQLPVWLWLTVLSCAWTAAFVSVKAGPQAAGKAAVTAKSSAQAPQAPPSTAKYVGDGDCATCHADAVAGYAKSPHHFASDPRTPAAAQSCETCHGPASEHIADPTNKPLKKFKKLAAGEVNATCVSCHNKGDHVLWDGSQHESRGLACTTCHSVHSPKSFAGQLKEKTQIELCANCHRDKASKVDRSGHMPVREGKMQCTSCHNVHGTTNVKLLRKGDSVAELCTSCHADKRGPYLWEHAPSRDGCVTCHDPHGSSNERMLVAKQPLLCQRCHIGTRHPSTVYDAATVGAGANPSIRVYSRGCVECHSAIHGSNHPSGQRFIR